MCFACWIKMLCSLGQCSVFQSMHCVGRHKHVLAWILQGPCAHWYVLTCTFMNMGFSYTRVISLARVVFALSTWVISMCGLCICCFHQFRQRHCFCLMFVHGVEIVQHHVFLSCFRLLDILLGGILLESSRFVGLRDSEDLWQEWWPVGVRRGSVRRFDWSQRAGSTDLSHCIWKQHHIYIYIYIYICTNMYALS